MKVGNDRLVKVNSYNRVHLVDSLEPGDERMFMMKEEKPRYRREFKMAFGVLGYCVANEMLAARVGRECGVDVAQPMRYDGAVLTEWLEGARPIAVGRLSLDELLDVAFYDAVIGNLDRVKNNMLLRPSGKLVLIDHELSFPDKARGVSGWFGSVGGAHNVVLSDRRVQGRGLEERHKGMLYRLVKSDRMDMAVRKALGVSKWSEYRRRLSWMMIMGRYLTLVDWSGMYE